MPSVGVCKEQADALIDAENHCIEYGDAITIKIFNESDIVRDDYKNIQERKTPSDTITIYAFPIDFTPNENRKEESGEFEEDEAIITTPTKTWTDNSISFKDIDIERWLIEIDGEEYEINKKQTQSELSNVHLYYVLYVNKR